MLLLSSIKQSFTAVGYNKYRILLNSLAFFTVFTFVFCSSNSNHLFKPVFNDQQSVLLENKTSQSNFDTFQLWEAANREQGGPNSFVAINYNKCIPVRQCKFEDCDIEGSSDKKGNFCLPVEYSSIGDWAPDISLNILGYPLLENPPVYTSPVEHTQASARLPDKDDNAYFMFSNSQNHYGFIWVVEVQGINPEQPEHIDSSMPANVVWWQKLNKCHSVEQCEDQYNPGNYNHPARISHIDGVAAIAFQNWSFTIQGKVDLSRVSSSFDNIKIPIPESLQTSTLPIYPAVRSADAVAFYDVTDPAHPKFVRKLVGDKEDQWGGYPPGRDISEVSIAKVGDYYHMNVGGTDYNYDGEGNNKLFFINYQMTSLLSEQNISPMLGDVNANMFTNVKTAGKSQPVMVSLNAVPNYIEQDYSLTLQLITSKLSYNTVSTPSPTDLYDHVFLENDSVFSTHLNLANANDRQLSGKDTLGNLIWMSEACKRAWGFQMMDNGGYNVVCHDINPKGTGKFSQGRFLVRSVSSKDKDLIRAKNNHKDDNFS